MLTDEQMKKLGVKDLDISDYLQSEDDIEMYLQEAYEEDDAIGFINALADAAKAYSILKLSKKMNVSRSSLYKSLNGSCKPSFETVFKLMKSMDIDASFSIKKRKKRKKELTPV